MAHDALLCVQTGALLSDTNRFKFEGTEHYLKSAAEMRHLFREVPEACDNTLLIAERADVQIELGQAEPARVPGARSLHRRHLRGAGARLPARPHRWRARASATATRCRPRSCERLDFELGVIGDMGFPAYFLVVWDLIRFARENGIRVGPGRGSAAGCCVAYCLRIVDLDPIRYDLLFERFLNPGRKQMPDIDMDFDERYRADVMRYAAEKYGSDRVAQIITFSTIKARAAVRDAARVLGKPYIVGDKIAKAMPPLIMGRDTPLRACLTKTEGHEDGYASAGELRTMHETDPEAKEVIDVALGLEGLRRQDGIHAAAVVISRDPLTDYLPIQRKPDAGGAPEDAPIVTQYEMHGVEELGLLKMDFLGPAQPLGDRAGARPDRGGDGGAARHRRRRPGGRAHARDAAAGRVGRRVPARGRGHAPDAARPRPDELRRRGRPGRAVPARAHGGQHAPRLPGAQERAQGARRTCTPTSSRSSRTPTG